MGNKNMFTTKKFGGKTWLFCMSGDKKIVESKKNRMLRDGYKTKVLKSGNEWDLWISQN